MTAMVFFRAGASDYAIPVRYVREVRSRGRLLPLPTPRPGVIGLLPDEATSVTVIAPLGDGDQVLLLDHDGAAFGLVVGEVTGVVTPIGAAGPPPAGQVGRLVSGVLTTPDGLVLVVDVAALDAELRA